MAAPNQKSAASRLLIIGAGVSIPLVALVAYLAFRRGQMAEAEEHEGVVTTLSTERGGVSVSDPPQASLQKQPSFVQQVNSVMDSDRDGSIAYSELELLEFRSEIEVEEGVLYIGQWLGDVRQGKGK